MTASQGRCGLKGGAALGAEEGDEALRGGDGGVVTAEEGGGVVGCAGDEGEG